MKKPIFLESASNEALTTLASCVTHFLCCFNTGSPTIVQEYTEPYLTNIELAPSRIKFTVVGVNPITAEAMEQYQHTVTINQSVWDDGVVKARVTFPAVDYSYGSIRVYISPCMVLFLNNNLSAEDTTVEIKTKTPLITAFRAGSNKVTISATPTLSGVGAMPEPELSSTGILAINGIRPQRGNIQIAGVGSTVVAVTAVNPEEDN